ncbi:MAG: hypothetical protein ACLQJ7_11815 [Syntrophobacteraceae bacterium]
MKTVCATIVGVAVGGLITFWVSWHFYGKASQDLRKTTENLLQIKHMEEISLKVMEKEKRVKLNQDAQGNITGVVIELGANVHGTYVLPQVEPEVKRGE